MSTHRLVDADTMLFWSRAGDAFDSPAGDPVTSEEAVHIAARFGFMAGISAPGKVAVSGSARHNPGVSASSYPNLRIVLDGDSRQLAKIRHEAWRNRMVAKLRTNHVRLSGVVDALSSGPLLSLCGGCEWMMIVPLDFVFYGDIASFIEDDIVPLVGLVIKVGQFGLAIGDDAEAAKLTVAGYNVVRISEILDNMSAFRSV